jgi:hypothetical protein
MLLKRKLSTLDWMLAIDFDNPRLLKIAQTMETSEEFPVYVFIDSFEAKRKKKTRQR